MSKNLTTKPPVVLLPADFLSVNGLGACDTVPQSECKNIIAGCDKKVYSQYIMFLTSYSSSR
jgi:hypothetical protein